MDLDWFSDNRALITASQELGIASVWDITTGEELLRYDGHEDAVNTASISSDDQKALTASADRTAHIWFTQSGETVQVFERHEGEVTDAIWSPDERQVATASSDGTIRLWDTETGVEQMRIEAHVGGVTALSWSSDGARIASAGNDGLGRIWDVSTGDLLFTLIGHDAVVRDIEWSPDDRLLATAGADGLVHVWELRAGIEQFALTGADTAVEKVSWSPNGERLAVSGGAFPRVWEVTTPIERLVGHTAGEENTFIQTNWPYWSPDSSWVGTGGYFDKTYRLWNPVTGENIRTFEDLPGAFASPNPAGTEIFLVNPPRIVNLETNQVRFVPTAQEFGDGFAVECDPMGA